MFSFEANLTYTEHLTPPDQRVDAVVEVLELFRDPQCESCFDGDVLGEIGELQVLTPEIP